MATDFGREIEAHRGYLLRVAQLQLRDRDLAEDVVQDTLVAALGGSGFAGKSSLKTWRGERRRELPRRIRRKQREPAAVASFGDLDAELDIEDFDALFKANGAWEAPPADWGDPEAALGRQEFFDVMDFCLEKLPPNTARVFMMREVMELESDEICAELAITANNLWVILYRARMALRECLEQNWFAGKGHTR